MASEYNFRCAAARKRRDGCQQARRRKVGKEGPCACKLRTRTRVEEPGRRETGE